MLVGRKSELGHLDAAFANALEGRGSVLFLTGDAGLGKTTLVHEWWELSRAEGAGLSDKENSRSPHPSALFLEAACSIPIGNSDVGSLEALQPWADVVAQLNVAEHEAAVSQTATPAKLNLKKLIHDSAPAWAWALPVVGDIAHAALETARAMKEQRDESGKVDVKKLAQDTASTWAMAIPIVGGIAHAAVETAQFARKQREAPPPSAMNQQQVFQQYVNLLTKISEEHPLVIFLDDLHWADASSCNLLFYLARQVPEKRILVIGTYRRDDAIAAADGKGHPIISVKNEILRYSAGSEVSLSYLNRESIQSILSAVVPSYINDDAFEQWLLKISDGNSLFVTQFIKTLLEDGHFDAQGRFTGAYDTITIPQSALAVVEERARRLDDDTREVLMFATAEGEEFTAYVVEQLTEKKPMDLLKRLHTAAKQGLIVERGKSRLFASRTTALFGFSHALFHKALYDQLFDAQKEHLHRQCYELLKAEWDRSAGTQEQLTLASKLVLHAEKCEEWEAVATIALASAKESWRNYSFDEALGMADKVLAATERGGAALVSHRAEAMLLRGLIRQHRWEADAAVADASSAEALFRECGDIDGVLRSISTLAATHWQVREFERSLVDARRGLNEAVAAHQELLEAQFLNNIGNTLRDQNLLDESLVNFERSLEIRRRLGDVAAQAASLINIGNVFTARSDYATAIEYMRQGLELARSSGHLRWQANALGNLGSLCHAMGMYDQGEAYIRESLELDARVGARSGEATGYDHLAQISMAKGEFERALEYSDHALALAQAIGERARESGVRINSAIALTGLGRFEEAREQCRKGLEIAVSVDHKQWEANAYAILGYVYRAEGRWKEALAEFQRSMVLQQASGFRLSEAEVYLQFAFCYVKLGQLAVAAEHLERGDAMVREFGRDSLAAEALGVRALLVEAEAETAPEPDRTQKLKQAIEHLNAGIVLADETHRPMEARELRRELARMQGRISAGGAH